MKDKYLYLILGALIIGNVIIGYRNVKAMRISNEVLIRGNVLPKNEDKKFIGQASWYDYEYPKGSGNWVTKNKLVVASRDYPRGTKLRVCHMVECVNVIVTDYGPEERTGRIIDMGSLAFSKICSKRDGVCNVSVEIID
ncbi:MAG: RlpA-like double-psi beta-barrel domain-containing protein [Candidatus Pacearchaeota archaeon]